MASSSVLAAASPAASAPVDVESLLWEVRDLLRGIGQVNKSQASELARLGSLLDLSISAEYHERAELALKSIDVALDQLALAPSASSDHQLEDADEHASESAFNDAHVVAWLSEMSSSSSSSAVGVAAPTSAVDASSDFWTTQEFNWDEEPEEEDSLPSSPSSMPGFVDPDPSVLDSWQDDDEVTPWDSVSVRGSESSDEEEQTSGSSGDDSATLFHSETRDDKYNRSRPRRESSPSYGKSLQLTRDQAYRAPVEYAILRSPPLLHHSAAIEGF